MPNHEYLSRNTRPDITDRIIVLHGSSVEGYEIAEYKEIIWYTAREGISDLDSMRYTSYENLKNTAKSMGANAIVNFHFDYIPANTGCGAEITAMGNAVVLKPIKNYLPTSAIGNLFAEYSEIIEGAIIDKHKSIETPTFKKSPVAEIINIGDTVYAVCPECGVKYNILHDENGKIKLHFEDVDKEEDGYQIYCSVCGAKFTIPER